MSITTNVSKMLGDGYAQVDITSEKSKPKSYKVPVNKVSDFSKNYKKREKNINIITNTVFATSILGGVIGTAALTRNMQSKALRFILNTCGGIALAFASIFATDKIIQNQKQKFLEKHGATKINYDA